MRPRIVTQLDADGTIRNVKDRAERARIIGRLDDKGSTTSEAMTKAIAPALQEAQLARAEAALPDGTAVWLVRRPTGAPSAILLSSDYASGFYTNVGYSVLAALLIRGFTPDTAVVVPVSADLQWALPGEPVTQGWGSDNRSRIAKWLGDTLTALVRRVVKGPRIEVAGIQARLMKGSVRNGPAASG